MKEFSERHDAVRFNGRLFRNRHQKRLYLTYSGLYLTYSGPTRALLLWALYRNTETDRQNGRDRKRQRENCAKFH